MGREGALKGEAVTPKSLLSVVCHLVHSLLQASLARPALLLGAGSPAYFNHAIAYGKRRLPMRHQHGSSARQCAQIRQHLSLGFGIERRGCFIKQQHRRLTIHGTRNGQPLHLPLGQPRSALS